MTDLKRSQVLLIVTLVLAVVGVAAYWYFENSPLGKLGSLIGAG